jgi:hypothetical protein
MAEAYLRQKKPEDWTQQGVLHAASYKVQENSEEALKIAHLALNSFPNSKNSQAADFLRRVESGKAKDLKVSFGVFYG